MDKDDSFTGVNFTDSVTGNAGSCALVSNGEFCGEATQGPGKGAGGSQDAVCPTKFRAGGV